MSGVSTSAADYRIAILRFLDLYPLCTPAAITRHVRSATFLTRAHRSGASGRGLIGVMRFKFVQLKITILLLYVKHAKRRIMYAVVNTLDPRGARGSGTYIACVRAPTEFLSDARTGMLCNLLLITFTDARIRIAPLMINIHQRV